MRRLRIMLLGLAFALPLAATHATEEVGVTGKTTAMTEVQSEPQGRCCFVWYLGSWWCIPC